VWVESGIKTNGVEALLNPDAPAVTVSHPEYFATREARRRFVRTVEGEPGETMYSLCFAEDILPAREFIKSRGLEVVRATPFELPFFSPSNRMGMMLLEVARPRTPEALAAFEATWLNAAFPEEDYRAEIKSEEQPATLRAGERTTLHLRVRNLGHSTWPAHGDAQGMFQVNAGDRWLDSEGTRVVNDMDGRTSLQSDLAPGGETQLALNVTAPKEPGEYVLEVDMIHEGVTFFHDKGSTPLRMRVRVEE
jgi:Ig-like domain from next to BRCA1 gene